MKWIKTLLAVFATATLLAACQGFPNPFKSAETSEQKAFALYGTFVAVEELAADLVENPDVPDSVKEEIRDLDAAVKPLADRVQSSAQLVARLRLEAEGAEGQSATLIAARLASAVATLDSAYADARPAITNFLNYVKRVD